MNQRLWSGLTAALILTALGASPSSQAGQSGIIDEEAGNNVPPGEALPEASTSDSSSAELSSIDSLLSTTQSPIEVVKVGEYQSQEEVEIVDEAIATIYSHEMDGQQAATLYVRDIPVLTFLGSGETNASRRSADTRTATSAGRSQPRRMEGEEPKVAAAQGDSQGRPAGQRSHPEQGDADASLADADYSDDPVWRATSVAARLNQLHRDNVDAESVEVRWDADRERFVISIDDNDLVEINAQTILPDSTNDSAEDALQATNRLRRQLGDADPLSHIEGVPSRPQQISLGPIQFSISGMASWYGPGFNGRRSASGEVFNQNALTAAHRSLPFGTMVEVTNRNNGLSVVVRINDRGPFSGGRVIDLSAGAARAIGMIQTGVAPVTINVLSASDTASNRN
ncbi:MAG: septal ring lytic transglycosylase RlpA family protein [Elainellaceae cyanobacterium]